MSKEEMNLYKRCKNIFKAHGVDMGGGSGGEGVTVVHVTATYVGDSRLDITADVSAERASEIIKAGGIVSVVLESHLPDSDSIWALGTPVFCSEYVSDVPYIWAIYSYDGYEDGALIPALGIKNGEWALIN